MSRGFSTKYQLGKDPLRGTGDYKRRTMGQRIDASKPSEAHLQDAAPDIRGSVAYCGRCHAIYHPKHWHLDEAEYQRLKLDPNVDEIVCPSCVAIEQKDFKGQVTLKGSTLAQHREQILNTIYNEEAHLRTTNPHSRIGLIEEVGEEIHVWTVNEFLAERIAKELKKAFHGSHAEINHLNKEEFTRVLWWREE
jgi:NMD protein affecting ribosome stability and mRNA decay